MAIPRMLDKVPVTGVWRHKVFGIPVDREIMFADHKHKHKPRMEKRQRKLMTKMAFIRPFLEPQEEFLLVTTGHSPPTILEKWGIGWLFLYLKRSLLIFTDRRIFHVPTTSIYRYRHSIAQIPYLSCESIQMKGASLLVQYKGGENTEKFISLSRKEKKQIRELLKMIPLVTGQSGISHHRVHLCPQCGARLYASAVECRVCKLRFKSGTVAARLASLLPGAGYFYLRLPFLGTAAALLEIGAMVLIGFSINNQLNGVPSSLPWLLVGILMLGVIKPFAAIHARIIADEFVPRPKDISFKPAGALPK